MFSKFFEDPILWLQALCTQGGSFEVADDPHRRCLAFRSAETTFFIPMTTMSQSDGLLLAQHFGLNSMQGRQRFAARLSADPESILKEVLTAPIETA